MVPPGAGGVTHVCDGMRYTLDGVLFVVVDMSE